MDNPFDDVEINPYIDRFFKQGNDISQLIFAHKYDHEANEYTVEIGDRTVIEKILEECAEEDKNSSRKSSRKNKKPKNQVSDEED